MKYNVDKEYLINCFKTIVNTPSPVGYYVKLNPVLEKLAKELGLSVTYDNRSTAYITLDGEDNSKTVLIGAHVDTLGLVVKCIESNGMLSVRKMGGVNFASIEGETVTVHTRDGREYSGLVICKSFSTHVFADATTMERNEDNMRILLDENVRCKDDVKALGIQNGDFISIQPRCQLTDNGYLKSRFIDDKGAVACCYTALKYLTENGLKPRFKTIFAFPYNEEIGLGGTYIPEGVSEFIAVDIGLVGPELDGDERKVSICAKDAATPYDFMLTNKLIDLAKSNGIDYAVDVFFRYGTDGGAALRAGHDLRPAVFGMAVYCSHGMERTHVEGLEATCALMLSYLLDA